MWGCELCLVCGMSHMKSARRNLYFLVRWHLCVTRWKEMSRRPRVSCTALSCGTSSARTQADSHIQTILFGVWTVFKDLSKKELFQASTQALKQWILVFAVVWQIDAVFTNICRHSMVKQMPPVLQKMHDLFSISHTNIYAVLALRAAEWEQWSSLSNRLGLGALAVRNTSSSVWAQR